MSQPETTSQPDVVFIHGMFMTPRCWQGWVERFAARGLAATAPAWPLHDASVAQQRERHPDPAVGALTLEQVVDHYRALLANRDRPVLVGHSMGGLVVQLLLQEDLGRAGVAIHSAPPKGVVALSWSFIKSNWGSINPFAKGDQAWLPTLEQFAYGFANGLPAELQQQAYDSQVVPESRKVGSGPTTDAAAIDYDRSRPPLLMIAGDADHMIPAALNRTNFDRYANAHGRSGNVTELEVMPERTHLTLSQPGWESVADRVIGWIRALEE